MGGAKKKAADKPSAADVLAQVKKDGSAHQCILCKQTFGATNKKPMLKAHQEAKHEKSTVEECFATYATAKD